MRDVAGGNEPQLRTFDRRDCERVSVQRQEFHLIGNSFFVDQHDRADISRHEIFRRQISRQHHAIEFGDFHFGSGG